MRSMQPIRFNPGYFDDAIHSLDRVIEKAERDLKGIEFDTLVGTGFSGGVVIPAMAMWLGVNYLLVRKESDDSHQHGLLLGTLGERWIFVDDFVQSGATRTRVMEQVSKAVVEHNEWWPEEPYQPQYVGDYLYMDRDANDERGLFKPINVTAWFNVWAFTQQQYEQQFERSYL